MSAMRLSIERMAYGTDAIAHSDDGKTVFVGGAVPGDLVEAEIYSRGSSFDKAHITQVLEPSENRVTPLCPYTNLCGGCPWASLSRTAQLEAKQAAVCDCLKRIGGFKESEIAALVAPCESPSQPWGYRNKIELALSASHGRTVIGMHALEPSHVVQVDRCALLDKQHNKLTKSLSGALAYLAHSQDLGLSRIGIRAALGTRDLEIALWGKPGAFPRSKTAKVLGDATHASSIVRVLMKGPQKARRVTGIEVLSGKGCWEERIGEESMLLSAPSFFQVNTVAASRLIDIVIEGLSPRQDDEVMDLYCGAGTFTIPFARRTSFVSAVEAYGFAVRDLRRNLERAGLDNVDPIGGDADQEFPDTQADIIIVDPPRAGLSADVVKKLSNQACRAIAYVSCDPATLARDLSRFRALGHFEPTKITPVDLFPQTFHVECVTLMSRVKE